MEVGDGVGRDRVVDIKVVENEVEFWESAKAMLFVGGAHAAVCVVILVMVDIKRWLKKTCSALSLLP